MSKLKKSLFAILIVIMFLCIASDGLYLVIAYCLPSKMVANTFNVSDLVTKDDAGNLTSLGKIMEINYYANEDGSGVEMFELKFNTLKNEKSSDIFSGGLQIVLESDSSKISSAWMRSNLESDWLGNSCVSYEMTFNGSTYYYNSDGNNTSYIASLSIENDSYFLITIGNEQFRMHPRKILSEDKKTLKNYYSEKVIGGVLWAKFCQRYYYDWDYIAATILKSVQSLEPGFDGCLTFKFGDLFDYYQFNEESVTYEKIERTQSGSLIEEVINNYYTIKVNTYYSGATVATDSLFNMIEGQSDFNKTNSSEMNDYSLSRQIISLNETHFDYKYVEGTDCDFKLKLKDDVKNFLQDKSKYKILITINLSELSNCDINYAGLIYDDFLTSELVYKVEVVQ